MSELKRVFKRARKIVPVILISLSFFFPLMMFISPNSKAIYRDVIPTADTGQFGRSRHDSAGGGGLNSYGDGNKDNYNPYGWNYNFREYFLTNRFDIFDDYWNKNLTPPDDALVYNVKVHMVATHSINAGYFSIGFVPVNSSWYAETEITLDDASEPFVTTWAGHDFGIWHNSTLFPYQSNYPYNVGVDWDITSLFTWNITLLKSPQLYIMWIQGQNHSGYVDYLGLRYGYEGPGTAGDILPFEDVSTNFSGLIWLLIVFFPAIAMGQYIPKIGFAAGIILMIIIVGTIYISFIPYTIIGIIAIGVMIYKGD